MPFVPSTDGTHVSLYSGQHQPAPLAEPCYTRTTNKPLYIYFCGRNRAKLVTSFSTDVTRQIDTQNIFNIAYQTYLEHFLLLVHSVEQVGAGPSTDCVLAEGHRFSMGIGR
jgi:hypothetical protein